MKLTHVYYLKRIYGSSTPLDLMMNITKYGLFINNRIIQTIELKDPFLILK